MKSILGKKEIIVHEVGAETSPEPIDSLGIKRMPEVGIEFLSSLQKINNIEEIIIFINSDFWSMRNLLKF